LVYFSKIPEKFGKTVHKAVENSSSQIVFVLHFSNSLHQDSCSWTLLRNLLVWHHLWSKLLFKNCLH